MATTKGIDVSVWNGNIDWSAAKNDIQFAILRAGYGRDISQKDTRFEQYYAGCKANGIKVGAYWYNYAVTVEDARNEANACLKALAGKKFDLPIWYDVEENATLKTGVTNVSNIIKAFCEIIEAAGYKVGVYSFYSALKNNISAEIRNKYDIWVAHVGNNGSALGATDYSLKTIWQYSWTGRVAGIGGDVDMDWCYKDYEEKKEEKPIEKPAEKKEEKKEEKPKTTTKPKETVKPAEKQIDVFYKACIGTWLPEVKNYNDVNDDGYAGIERYQISGFCAKSSEGKLRYRVHLKNGGWLSWIDQYNQFDWSNGCAGLYGRVIDGLQMELVGVPGYQVEYRVSPVAGKAYYPWVKGLADYAGLYGQSIDKIQVRIVKA